MNYRSGGEFLETPFELIGSAHTDGSPVHSGRPCSVDNTLHTAGLSERRHPLSLRVCEYIRPIAIVCVLYEGGLLQWRLHLHRRSLTAVFG